MAGIRPTKVYILSAQFPGAPQAEDLAIWEIASGRAAVFSITYKCDVVARQPIRAEIGRQSLEVSQQAQPYFLQAPDKYDAYGSCCSGYAGRALSRRQSVCFINVYSCRGC